MKITIKNYYYIFFNIGHHVLYLLTKFELKIQFVCGEIKKRNIIRGYIGLIRIVGRVI
jgi:hypothetical protein